ncbi:hypothetical protein PFISCL1PPCAC_7104, partial [Pristionchus fissidentatus]
TSARMPLEDFIFANLHVAQNSTESPIPFDEYNQFASTSSTVAHRRPPITQSAPGSAVIVIPHSILAVSVN